MKQLNEEDLRSYIDEAPYNYCDYRCEVCSYQTTCRVYQQERKQTITALMNGENPFSPEFALKTVAENFADAFRLLQEGAIEHGIDLNEIKMTGMEEEEYEALQEVIDNHPLNKRSLGFFSLVYDYDKNCLKERECAPHLNEPYYYLRYYAPMIGAKMHRAIHGWFDREDGDEIHFIDAYLSTKVAYASAFYCKNALEYILAHQKDFKNEVSALLTECNGIIEDIKVWTEQTQEISY